MRKVSRALGQQDGRPRRPLDQANQHGCIPAGLSQLRDQLGRRLADDTRKQSLPGGRMRRRLRKALSDAAPPDISL
jgi:hypothetical protein